jgi:hypothetical protein
MVGRDLEQDIHSFEQGEPAAVKDFFSGQERLRKTAEPPTFMACIPKKSRLFWKSVFFSHSAAYGRSPAASVEFLKVSEKKLIIPGQASVPILTVP